MRVRTIAVLLALCAFGTRVPAREAIGSRRTLPRPGSQLSIDLVKYSPRKWCSPIIEEGGRKNPPAFYSLYLPRQFDKHLSWPLVFAFASTSAGRQGGISGAGRYAAIQGMAKKMARRDGTVVVALTYPVRYAGGHEYRYPTKHKQKWISFFKSILADVKTLIKVDEDNIFIMGHASGADQAAAMAFSGSIAPLLKGVILLGGWKPPRQVSMPKGGRIFLMVGDRDPPFDKVKKSYGQFIRRGMEVRYEEISGPLKNLSRVGTPLVKWFEENGPDGEVRRMLKLAADATEKNVDTFLWSIRRLPSRGGISKKTRAQAEKWAEEFEAPFKEKFDEARAAVAAGDRAKAVRILGRMIKVHPSLSFIEEAKALLAELKR